MDIRAYAKRMSELACRPQAGDTLDSFCRRYRAMKSRNLKFWRTFVGALKELMRAALKAPLRSTWMNALCIGALILHVFVGVLTETFTAIGIKQPKPESARDPPLLFFPIPKAETGGCARSDSLVHSLIF